MITSHTAVIIEGLGAKLFYWQRTSPELDRRRVLRNGGLRVIQHRPPGQPARRAGPGGGFTTGSREPVSRVTRLANACVDIYREVPYVVCFNDFE